MSSNNYNRSRQPWWKRWFGRTQHDEEGLGSTPLQSNYNIAALATVLLPIIILFVARIIIRDGQQWWNWDMDGDGEGWWNGEWDPERWRGIATWLVFIISMLVFAGLVYHGNYVLERRTSDRNLKPLVSALFVFAFMAMLLAIMVSANRPIDGEGDGEFLGRFATFHGLILLTFIFWAIWAFAFAFHLRSKVRSVRRNENNGDYYRDDRKAGLI